MKSFIKIVGLTMAAIFMLAGSAMANSITITWQDTTVNWPGYKTTPYGDEYGTPKISSFSLTYDAVTRDLESIVINMTDRRVWDSLFINNDGDGYGNWDFYVRDNTMDESVPPTNATLSTVAANYQYTFCGALGRTGHPNGIEAAYLTPVSGLLASLIWDSTANTLTYTFNDGIVLGQSFQIGYTPWCANDVILTPEPGILMLLGFGILGLAGFRRRVKK